LYDYKAAGKGLKAWFDDRYFHDDGLMHPRFIPTGTSMGRLSSADPNFQNIPRIGFGKRVRKAIVPRDPSLKLTKADKSQL
jgi:DNA polymerase I-like protein with 3'-5' exonuclease and polymerase domains